MADVINRLGLHSLQTRGRAPFPLTSWAFRERLLSDKSDTLPAWSSWRIAWPPTRRFAAASVQHDRIAWELLMDASALLHRRVSAFAVTAVCLAALGAAGHALRTQPQESAPARPAADAPADMVKAPPEPAMDRLTAEACRTCAMGVGRGTL
jgi:hypothetical protein